MSALLDKLKKSGSVKASSILSKSVFFVSKETIPTDLPILNIAFSGDVEGGLTSGVTIFAGQSKCYKSFLAIYAMKAYMDKYPDAIALFYDVEFGIPTGYMESIGMDLERVIHIPVTNIEELKFDMVKRLEQIERGDKVFIMVDSIGNMASKREVENALAENSAADMTRAKEVKSFFRIITPHITMKDLPCVIINHTYKEQGLFPKDIVSGGCVVEDTKILMSDGSYKNIQDIIVGDTVKTILGDREVTNAWNPNTLLEGFPICYEVTFEDGYSVICSENHKFLMVNKEWKEAKDISVGNFFAKNNGSCLEVSKIECVGRRYVYDISVAEAEHYVLENGLVTHNTGVMYSANTVFIITKAQEKQGTDIVGYNFTINIEKSRFVREKAKMTFQVLWESGINKYSGLLDIALESGHVIKPSNGWYSRVNRETGEVEEKKYRLKDTYSEEFWDEVLKSPSFQNFVKKRFQLGATGSPAEASDEDMYDEE